MSLGKKIEGLREKMGLNKSDLAKVLRLSHVQIIRYERNESIPPTEKLRQMADFFGVTMDFLLEKKKSDTSKVDLTQKELEKIIRLPDADKKKVFDYVNLLLDKHERSQ